jgi:hypothetical protein
VLARPRTSHGDFAELTTNRRLLVLLEIVVNEAHNKRRLADGCFAEKHQLDAATRLWLLGVRHGDVWWRVGVGRWMLWLGRALRTVTNMLTKIVKVATTPKS